MPIKKARLKISELSQRRKSSRHKQERRMRMVSLSLTSMVDMFAMLVIFLLANMDSFQEWVKVGHGIILPHAVSREVPAQAPTLQVSFDSIYANDKPIVSLKQQSLVPLRYWLLSIPKKEGYVNIVAHQKISFGMMKRIITVCQEAGFSKVNLAVQPKVRSVQPST